MPVPAAIRLSGWTESPGWRWFLSQLAIASTRPPFGACHSGLGGSSERAPSAIRGMFKWIVTAVRKISNGSASLAKEATRKKWIGAGQLLRQSPAEIAQKYAKGM